MTDATNVSRKIVERLFNRPMKDSTEQKIIMEEWVEEEIRTVLERAQKEFFVQINAAKEQCDELRSMYGQLATEKDQLIKRCDNLTAKQTLWERTVAENERLRELLGKSDAWRPVRSGAIDGPFRCVACEVTIETAGQQHPENGCVWLEARMSDTRKTAELSNPEAIKGMIEAARIRVRQGHHEECDSFLSSRSKCDCGHDQLEKALTALGSPPKP